MCTRTWLLLLFLLSFGSSHLSPATEWSQCVSEQLKLLGLSDSFQIDFRGFTEKELASPRTREQLEEQVSELTVFLSQLKEDSPFDNCPFCRVTVRPKPLLDATRKSMAWQGGNTLNLFVPKLPFLGYRVQDAEAMRQTWDSGSPLPRQSPIKPYWQWINPTGSFRLTVRRSLKEAATLFEKTLGRLNSDTISNAELNALIKKETGGGDTLSPRAKRIMDEIASWDANERKHLIDIARTNAKDSLQIAELEGSIVGAIADGSREIQEEVSTTATGLVAITNSHTIALGASLGGSKDPQRHFKITPLKRSYKGRSYGVLVGVSTSDLVSVHVDYSGSLGTSAFEKALESLATARGW